MVYRNVFDELGVGYICLHVKPSVKEFFYQQHCLVPLEQANLSLKVFPRLYVLTTILINQASVACLSN